MTRQMTTSVRRIAHENSPEHLPALIALLQDAVDSGASVGFLHPLPAEAATAYGTSVHGAVRTACILIGGWSPQGAREVQGVLSLEEDRGRRRRRL
jgi:hypothetical protein